MGGKVAMELALRLSEMVSKLVVVDVALVTYKPSSSPRSAHTTILAMNAIQLEKYTSSSEIDRALAVNVVTSLPVRQFVMTNLLRDIDQQSGRI